MKTSIFKSIVSLILVIAMLFSFSAYFVVNAVDQIGTVVKDSVRVRTTPTTTTSENKLTVNGVVVNLNTGDEVTILDTVDSDGDDTYKTWYHIEFSYSGKTYKGYVYSGFVEINEKTDDFVMPEGVPEEYKEYIEELLSYHPNWKFEFYDTGYDWNDLFNTTNGQGVSGRSVLQKPSLSYRSTASGNYNWRTDEWTVQDAGGWYQVNSQVIAYYMDPRNFLTNEKVFMFESLSYDATTQTVDGIKTILSGSFMDDEKINDTNGNSILYADAYIDAAEYSLVSPYHLAARTIQEVGKSGSGSTDGKYSGYEGYYNFYNINASAGTTPIANGLKFAKTGGSMSNKNKEKCLIPWDSQYKSIVGGGYWIGMSYINSTHKQNTLYFQKFNTSNPNDAFYHQYMTNVAAPSSEASSVKKSYSNMGILDNSFTFIIPYYRNMPKEACELPEKNNYSPNNWLKSLTVGSYDIDFDGGTTSYKLTVPATVTSIKISATTVNSKAKVSGTGTISLKEGSNAINVVVTAENGDKRTYTVNITRTSEGKIPLKSISLNKTSVSLYVDDSQTLSVTYNPTTTTDSKTVTWTSSNTKVATVKNGKITAVGTGTATITAKVGSCTATCKVTVSSKSSIVVGDVDADGDVTIADALMIFKYKSGEVKLSNTALKAADTDKNGNVELADALRIFKFKSGEIDKL